MGDSDFEEEFDHWLSGILIDKNSVVTCLFKIEESLYPDGAACEKKIESAGALKSKVSFVYKSSGNTAGRSDEQIVTTESIESENLINSGYSGEITSKIVNDYLPELKKTEIEGDNGSSGFDLFDRMIEEIIQGK